MRNNKWVSIQTASAMTVLLAILRSPSIEWRTRMDPAIRILFLTIN